MKYTLENLKKYVNESGKVVVRFFDDIDDIDYTEEMSLEEALNELNETYGCYLV